MCHIVLSAKDDLTVEMFVTPLLTFLFMPVNSNLNKMFGTSSSFYLRNIKNLNINKL